MLMGLAHGPCYIYYETTAAAFVVFVAKIHVSLFSSFVVSLAALRSQPTTPWFFLVSKQKRQLLWDFPGALVAY